MVMTMGLAETRQIARRCRPFNVCGKHSKAQNATGWTAVPIRLLLVPFLVWSLETWLGSCDYRIRLVRVLAADTMTHTWFAVDLGVRDLWVSIDEISTTQNDRTFRQAARLHLLALFTQA